MAYRATVDCPQCNSIVFISEMPLGGAGVGYMEDIHCPECGKLLEERRTTGSFNVHIVDKHLPEDNS